MQSLVADLKTAILLTLSLRGRGAFAQPPSPEAIRACAELVADGLVRDEEEDGKFYLTITRKGLEATHK